MKGKAGDGLQTVQMHLLWGRHCIAEQKTRKESRNYVPAQF